MTEGTSLFNSWVGKDETVSITDGKKHHALKGNLVAPVEFGSSETHPTIQVADLLAGISLEAFSGQHEAATIAGKWLREHQMHSHSVDFMPELARANDRRVRIGREMLKELANRAESNQDPLDGIEAFLRRTELRFQS